MKIKEMIDAEKPRERLEMYGAENISCEELIAILIRTGTKGDNSKEIASKILGKYKNINKLSDATVNSLMNIKGIGKAKAISLIAAIELGKRVNIKEDSVNINLKNTNYIFEYMKKYIENEKQECFYALYLDTKLKLISKKLLFKGTLSNACVHPREVFKEAFLESAAYIVVVHNHPSGDPTPSSEDNQITNVLFQIGDIMGIKVLDHIIIGNNSFYSYYEKKRENILSN